ncbi:hypothetical protein M758_6G013300 [Ceratodon purpureus]|nr:hypothetical protein M758_6G013300 [Ceratodon purpureus]
MARVEGGACGVSRILGTTMPTRDNWLDTEWVSALHGLSSRGVTLAAFQLWCRNVSLGNPIAPDMDTHTRKRGLVEVLPNLFLNKEALLSKLPALRLFVSGLEEHRFHEEAYLQEIKAYLEVHKLMYWGRPDVTIVVRCRLSPSEKGVPVRVQQFYSRVLPIDKRASCVTLQEGSKGTSDYIRPWIMQCGSSIGIHRTKKVARMIAIIKHHLDPSFDPEDDSPPPTMCGLWNEIFQSRKRKFEQVIDKPESELDPYY